MKTLIAVLALVVETAAAAQGLPAPQVTAPAHAAEVPFESWGGRPVIAVTIDGGGPYRFLFDTGASGCLVTPDLVADLELPEIGRTRIGSPMGGTPVERSLFGLGKLDVGGVGVAGLACASLDVLQASGMADAPAGVIGLTAFGDLLVTLDYVARRMRLETGSLPPADDVEVFAYGADPRLPSLPTTVAGMPLDLHVDSGSPGAVTLPAPLAGRLPLAEPPVEVGRARTVDGEVVVTEATLAGDVRIGPTVLERPRVRFAGNRPMGELGAGFLGDYRITFDHSDRRLRLVRAPRHDAGEDAPDG